MVEWVKTRFPGVRFWISDTRKHKGKPDKCYVIRFKRHGKSFSETIGWESGGVTPQYCANLRGQIITNIKSGAGPQSLAEKRDIENTRREEEAEQKAVLERENIPFHAIAARYLDHVKSSGKKSWKDDQSRYEHHLKSFLGDKPIKDFSILTIEGLKKHLQKKNVTKVIRSKDQKTGKPKVLHKELKGKTLSPATVKHVLVLVRQIFNWAIARKLIHGENPVRETAMTDKKLLKIPDNRRARFFSREEADMLLEELTDKAPMVHDVCLVSIYAGLRMSEIFSLKVADLDFSHDVISVKDAKGGSRTAYMTAPIKIAIENRLKENGIKSGLVFRNQKGGKLREMPNAYEKAVQKLGFNNGVTDRRDKAVAHTLRHTFGSWLAIDGVPLVAIQKLMGHKKLETTLIYAHLMPSQEKQAAFDLANWKPGDIVKLKEKKKK